MKLVIASLLAVSAWTAIASSDELINSPLMSEGELQKSREPLSQIFQFTIAAGQLTIDRLAWERNAQEIAKSDADRASAAANNLPPGLAQNPQFAARMQAVQQESEAREKQLQAATIARMGPVHPLHVVFRKIEEQARKASRGFSGGGKFPSSLMHGGWKEWQSAFEGDTLAGELRTNSDGEGLVLRELQSPKRMLEFGTGNKSQFRIQLSDRDGNMILLRQADNGRFFVVVIANGKSFADQAESFVAFFKQHRQLMESGVLPALAQFGICPILPPDTASVRDIVLATLLQTRELRSQGQRLIADLDSDSYDARERASAELRRRYIMYKDLIQDKLSDKSSSAEVQARVQRIVAEQTDTPLPAQTASALNLVNDPTYVVSLLVVADSRDKPQIIAHLEKITGQQLGSDAAAWKQWAHLKK